ncbi:hypothetical protein NBM05_11780 [Rothia sp. AR01]|uniref:Uncharacterized protein n=1 Tax=Rothia santali TaxID=2949643 RepID=A0A9X2HHI7_9MICC|nr:hypothetical protein [Rothia santali]MCP3426662.1 hypothetical protein [Rothia santali]
MSHPTGAWTVEYDDRGRFERFFRGLGEYEQAVLVAAVQNVLEPLGTDMCRSEWGKPLGGGLYEFRVRRSLRTLLREFAPQEAGRFDDVGDRPVLLRVFCTFHGRRVILLLGGYDKNRDPSKRRQERGIKAARRELAQWKRRG